MSKVTISKYRLFPSKKLSVRYIFFVAFAVFQEESFQGNVRKRRLWGTGSKGSGTFNAGCA